MWVCINQKYARAQNHPFGGECMDFILIKEVSRFSRDTNFFLLVVIQFNNILLFLEGFFVLTQMIQSSDVVVLYSETVV